MECRNVGKQLKFKHLHKTVLAKQRAGKSENTDIQYMVYSTTNSSDDDEWK